MACPTGNGTTFTLDLTGSVGRIFEIGANDFEIPLLEDDDLSSAGNMPLCKGDLATYTPIPISVVWDDTLELVPEIGVEQTATMTTPPLAGYDTGTVYSGLGWITKVTHPDRINNQRLEGGFEWTWQDGYNVTPPTPTP